MNARGRSPGSTLRDAGVTCAEEFCSDTAQYVAAQRPTASNTVTIHGPASGVIVGSHAVTQHAGHAVQSANLDVAALTRFAEAVAQALPVLALASRERGGRRDSDGRDHPGGIAAGTRSPQTKSSSGRATAHHPRRGCLRATCWPSWTPWRCGTANVRLRQEMTGRSLLAALRARF